MTRRFNKDRAAVLLNYSGDDVGLLFGAAVVKCNLPLAYVAELFELTRNTIDSWLAGKPVRSKYYTQMVKYTARFNDDYESAKLPCRTLKKARGYIDELKVEYGISPHLPTNIAELVKAQVVEEVPAEQ
jgi:hypothetical protein